MTVQQLRRYESSSARNFDNFVRRDGKKPPVHFTGTEEAQINYAHFCGMELLDLKHHLGIRPRDINFDVTLTDWLNKVKAHAKKAGIAAKPKKEATPSEPEAIVKALIKAGAEPDQIKIAVVVDGQATPEPVKKINPKKAARQAAIEASGTAPGKRVNADAQRAQAMAAKTKRQPRIMTKH